MTKQEINYITAVKTMKRKTGYYTTLILLALTVLLTGLLLSVKGTSVIFEDLLILMLSITALLSYKACFLNYKAKYKALCFIFFMNDYEEKY